MKRPATRALCVLGLLFGMLAHAATLEDFLRAAESNDVSTLSELLRRGMPPDATDEQGYSVLMYAARAGSLEATRLLLDHEANVDMRNFVGETALMLAAINGHLATVDALLERGAAVREKREAWTALHYAANQNHVEIVRRLLERGADPNARAVNGITPLHMAAREGAVAAIELLLGAGADPARRTAQGETPERWATKYGHQTAAERLAASRR